MFGLGNGEMMWDDISGQISSRPHTTSPQKVAKEGKSPYFREIQVGEIL